MSDLRSSSQASVSYQPLARKYRPAQFSELVGQDATAQAIANAISIGREPHAVIFAGVRGVGKTTTARLYAKALNCEKGPTATPCMICESCLAITAGNHEDVLEIDGASNTGVDDVRALRETVGYMPQRSKFKVYIIDEVHMLSSNAFNALLKTLEEPPQHVVFVFATTELQKIPRTILSRCQIFQLQKLPVSIITQRLEAILQAEGVAFDPRALTQVAREGHGSMRDALTLLDQVIALGAGKVSLEVLREIIAQISSVTYLTLLEALVRRDAQSVLNVLAGLDQQGASFSAVIEDVARFARHGFVLKDLGEGALDIGLLGLDDQEIAQLKTIASSADAFDLNRIFRTLVKCRLDLDGSELDRYVVENYALEWCLDPGLPDLETFSLGASGAKPAAAKPNLREALVAPAKPSAPPSQKTSSGKGPAAPARPQDTAALTPEAAAPPPVQQVAVDDRSFPTDWNALVERWKRQKPLQARKLEETYPVTFSPERIVLAVAENSYAAASLLGKDEQLKVRDQFVELFGFKGVLQIVPKASLGAQAQPPKAMARDPLAEAPRPAAPVQPQQDLPESILEARLRSKKLERERVLDDAKNAPATKEALAIFGGKIEDIKITDSSLI